MTWRDVSAMWVELACSTTHLFLSILTTEVLPMVILTIPLTKNSRVVKGTEEKEY